MRYETVFALSPVLSDEQVKDARARFRERLQGLGCTLLYEEYWGLRRLLADNSFLKEEHRMSLERGPAGYYILFEYDARDVTAVKDFEMALKRNDSVVHYQSARLS